MCSLVHDKWWYMCDIHDGLIWKDGEDFLSAPFNYLLILNIDWFSPFKHGYYSVGDTSVLPFKTFLVLLDITLKILYSWVLYLKQIIYI